MPTLDEYLQTCNLKNKDIAVVGPNMRVDEDPSPLYFANKIVNIPGTITILDDVPRITMESHGNIECYMEDFQEYVNAGVQIKKPQIIIGDITKTTIKDKFDFIYEVGTTKCILHVKARDSKKHTFKEPAKQIINAYHQMLKIGGEAIIVFPVDYAGMACFTEIAQKDSRLKTTFAEGLFSVHYTITNINVQQYNQYKKKLRKESKYLTPLFKTSKSRTITLGDGYAKMRILKLKKR